MTVFPFSLIIAGLFSRNGAQVSISGFSPAIAYCTWQLVLVVLYSFSVNVYISGSGIEIKPRNVAVGYVDESGGGISRKILSRLHAPEFLPPRRFASQEALSRAVDRALDDCDVLLLPSLPIPAPPVGATTVDVDGLQAPVKREPDARAEQSFRMAAPASAVCGNVRPRVVVPARTANE